MLQSTSIPHLARADYNLKTYCARAFACISAPELRNQLPDDIRSSDNLTNFKSKLKIFFKYRFQELVFISILFFTIVGISCKVHRAVYIRCTNVIIILSLIHAQPNTLTTL